MEKMLNFFRAKITKLTDECEKVESTKVLLDCSDETPSQLLKRRSWHGIVTLKVQAIRYYQRHLESALRTFFPIIKPDSIPNFAELVVFSVD